MKVGVVKLSQLNGAGPDAPTGTNAQGGKQSDIPYRFDLLPPLALGAVARTLKAGADKYGIDNWRLVPVEDQINHCIMHLVAYLAGDRSDDHLAHAACRALFAAELEQV